MSAPGLIAAIRARLPGTPISVDTTKPSVARAALEAGADDVITNDDGSIEVVTAPYEFTQVKAALEKAGFKPELAEVTMKPGTETELKGDDAAKMQRLLDALEGLDDVQEVYSTAVIDGSG